MRIKMASKFALAASLALAFTFTLGCGEHSFEEWLGLSSDSSSDSLSSSSRSSSSGGDGSSSGYLSSSSITYNTNEEIKLYNLIMEYRAEKGLPSIPISKSLTYVAQAHARDLHENLANIVSPSCNGHSWSDKGSWKGCCYSSANARCMWDKPRELTSYESNGYEIGTYWPTLYMTAEEALDGWKSSPAHNSVIVHEAPWQNFTWKAIGIGMYRNVAFTWFGALEECDDGCNDKYKRCWIKYSNGATFCKNINESYTLAQCIDNVGQPTDTEHEECKYNGAL